MNLFNTLVSCGVFTDIDPILPAITSTIVDVIQIAIPLMLIFFGLLDLGKAVMANDEKVMKEAQSKLIKRFLYAILVFLLVAIVKLVFNLVGTAGIDSDTDTGDANITECINCFINGKCE